MSTNSGDTIQISKNVLLAAVIVLMATASVVSGWLVISALNGPGNQDPFVQERDYTVIGTLDSVGCTGTAHSYYSSETSAYSVFSIDVKCTAGSVSKTIRVEIMFDENKIPADPFEKIGESEGSEQWRGPDGTLYTLDGNKIITKVDVAKDGAILNCVLI